MSAALLSCATFLRYCLYQAENVSANDSDGIRRFCIHAQRAMQTGRGIVVAAADNREPGK